MEQITVKVPPHADPTLAGRARVRKPWQPDRWFSEVPEVVERTPDIVRMLLRGDLVEVPAPAPEAEVTHMIAPRGAQDEE